MSPTVESSSAPSRPAPGPEPDPATFVRVRTTLPRRPLPPNATRQPIVTERLILRVLTIDDLPALYTLRTQPEVMHWTSVGVPDQTIEESKEKLLPFLTPRDEGTFNFAICDRASGDLIGLGGSHNYRSSLGWPEVGYMIRKEYWGRGLGTEFLRAWLPAWSALEREEAEVEVDARTMDEGEGKEEGGDGKVRERLIAITADANDRSQGVLKKAGFEWFLTWVTGDSRKGTGPDLMIELPSYRFFVGGKKVDGGEVTA
ncbi:GNAT domain-containing protein [Chaetomium tenue]|uniref:GNAT domain-containing protein n=1 Tax=Chaetomium tenue TaxID=1854479 RepID=A0ACB7PQC3_9PEZI|nr:GNAT domain-containing protein [Chaetomium globosum]